MWVRSLASFRINQHQSASFSINQHQLTSISINQHQHHHHTASHSINKQHTASISINRHQSASISINQHKSASISNNQHQSISIRINSINVQNLKKKKTLLPADQQWHIITKRASLGAITATIRICYAAIFFQNNVGNWSQLVRTQVQGAGSQSGSPTHLFVRSDWQIA